ncbi:esterase-like activity of phytase family protein [Kocuria sp.]|uniref:esterase-like activity of phytase family protein n=1 Tax=Kocuria sp. TaxID=1871328 RepID=UPI0026DC7DA2|nr:esterase-like activity of phytase family protein [Kocuria sp.]MDO4918121.1 esterase-like activity of phytase family protein [Kocuria sp.]
MRAPVSVLSLAAAAAAALSVSLVAPAHAAPAVPQKAESAQHHSNGKARGQRSGAQVFDTSLPDLGTVGGVAVKSSAYGSALAPKPGTRDVFYGLTDRGPNVDGPGGVKIEPYPDYAPQIGEFKMVNGSARLQRVITLKGRDNKPFTGQVSPQASTGETIQDLNGRVLPTSDHGFDSEGLVALPDGTFWVSDEYGPFITHFDCRGREIERLSPTASERSRSALPGELGQRDPNKGMEGLTVTPDGRTLVGVMQSALVTADLKGKPKNVVPVRIVTVDLRTRATHQYLYMRHLDSASTNISEITALSSHEFLLDERDGETGKDSFKRLYKVDLKNATDVSQHSPVKGATYDAAKGGLLLDGTTSIEGLTGKKNEKDARTALADAGITPVRSELYLDMTRLAWGIDPTGGFFAHDKIEGVAVARGGRELWISNDSDYGLSGSTGAQAPYGLVAKTLPDGTQDDGEFLRVDMDRVSRDAVGPGYRPCR